MGSYCTGFLFFFIIFTAAVRVGNYSVIFFSGTAVFLLFLLQHSSPGLILLFLFTGTAVFFIIFTSSPGRAPLAPWPPGPLGPWPPWPLAPDP